LTSCVTNSFSKPVLLHGPRYLFNIIKVFYRHKCTRSTFAVQTENFDSISTHFTATNKVNIRISRRPHAPKYVKELRRYLQSFCSHIKNSLIVKFTLERPRRPRGGVEV
jgi:hypothetical protein